MTLQGYWAEQRAPVFRDLPANLVAVLPVGAIEQHGPHLPMSVDRDLVDATVARCLAHLVSDQNVLFLPTLGITKSGEHDRHPGTLSLSADTLLATLRDIGASVARAGVERLVFLNGHGGNTAVLDVAARDLRISHDMIVVAGSWLGFAEFEGVFDAEALEDDIHAGDSETSAMLAARPELVDAGQARNFVSATRAWKESNRFIGLTGRPARPAWIIDDLNVDGACGDASDATAEKGRHLLETAARNFALFLAEFARFDSRRHT
ncbi:MAG: creatininase family protein [Boseongicola sp. SB0675_bin_26]|nr:creatininase family protein [Boseongicola sp. SB0675_bin_26]